MATFIVLVNFTEQGIRNIKESPNRAEAFKSVSGKLGVALTSIYWTVGSHDMIAVLEGPEEGVTAALLSLGSLGNVRTQTLRAFTADEMKRMVAKMP